MPPYFINFTSIILGLPFLLFSFLDYQSTFMSKPPLHHVSAIRCSQVRNAFETPALLALDYFTNEILILGRITFFNQIDSRWH